MGTKTRHNSQKTGQKLPETRLRGQDGSAETVQHIDHESGMLRGHGRTDGQA